MISYRDHPINQVEDLKSYGVYSRKKIAPLLSKYMTKATLEETVNTKGFHSTIGAYTDSVPFHQRGYYSIDLVTRAGGEFTLNKYDTPDKTDSKVLLGANFIVRKALLLLDKNYVVICKNEELICEDN